MHSVVEVSFFFFEGIFLCDPSDQTKKKVQSAHNTTHHAPLTTHRSPSTHQPTPINTNQYQPTSTETTARAFKHTHIYTHKPHAHSHLRIALGEGQWVGVNEKSTKSEENSRKKQAEAQKRKKAHVQLQCPQYESYSTYATLVKGRDGSCNTTGDPGLLCLWIVCFFKSIFSSAHVHMFQMAHSFQIFSSFLFLIFFTLAWKLLTYRTLSATTCH